MAAPKIPKQDPNGIRETSRLGKSDLSVPNLIAGGNACQDLFRAGHLGAARAAGIIAQHSECIHLPPAKIVSALARAAPAFIRFVPVTRQVAAPPSLFLLHHGGNMSLCEFVSQKRRGQGL